MKHESAVILRRTFPVIKANPGTKKELTPEAREATREFYEEFFDAKKSDPFVDAILDPPSKASHPDELWQPATDSDD